MSDFLLSFFFQFLPIGLFSWLSGLLGTVIGEVDWKSILKISFFLSISLAAVCLLLTVNDKVFSYYSRRRVKKHSLTISNNGNTPSVFLLRPVNLPKSLAMRFRIGGNPMIWVTQVDRKNEKAEQAKPEKTKAPEKEERSSSVSGLIPDLSDPLKAVESVRKGASNVSKKAGLISSIISGFTNLFGIKSAAMKSAAGALKDVQQTTNESVAAVNTKISSAEQLGSQIGSFLPKSDSMPMGIDVNITGGGDMRIGSGQASESEQNSNDWIGSNFVYDEEVWQKNIDKVDESGGSLVYAQSKVLDPGESMKIDVEIMNLSESSSAVSHLYKIEVVQIPQTNLHLAAPRQYISGIVIYTKVSRFERVLPPLLINGLILIAIQVIATLSYLLF